MVYLTFSFLSHSFSLSFSFLFARPISINPSHSLCTLFAVCCRSAPFSNHFTQIQDLCVADNQFVYRKSCVCYVLLRPWTFITNIYANIWLKSMRNKLKLWWRHNLLVFYYKRTNFLTNSIVDISEWYPRAQFHWHSNALILILTRLQFECTTVSTDHRPYTAYFIGSMI